MRHVLYLSKHDTHLLLLALAHLRLRSYTARRDGNIAEELTVAQMSSISYLERELTLIHKDFQQ